MLIIFEILKEYNFFFFFIEYVQNKQIYKFYPNLRRNLYLNFNNNLNRE